MTTMTTKHYVLCQHGLLGYRVDFQRLVEHYPSSSDRSVEIVVLQANEHVTGTLDGVEAAGKRCTEEIAEFVNSRMGCEVTVLGHSMGGLILRYALRCMYIQDPEFWAKRKIKLRFAIFVATPHCGIEHSSWAVRCPTKLLLRHISNTARDLTLCSPVLCQMTDTAGVDSLNQFERVVLYANAHGDSTVSARSGLILPHAIPHGLVLERQVIMTINEYTFPSETVSSSTTAPGSESSTDVIETRLNAGLKRVRRFLVEAPGWVPSFLKSFDNTAHTQIISHGLLDRGRVGMPMIQHISSILEGADPRGDAGVPVEVAMAAAADGHMIA